MILMYCKCLGMDVTQPSMKLAELVKCRVALLVHMLAGNGGCFPMHFDSDELLDSRRVSNVCAVADCLYMNFGLKLTAVQTLTGKLAIKALFETAKYILQRRQHSRALVQRIFITLCAACVLLMVLSNVAVSPAVDATITNRRYKPSPC
jgi:hypothetical protein